MAAPHEPLPRQAGDGVRAERELNFLLAKAEKRALRVIARRLTRWILPDDLTALGVISAVGISAAYVLSNHNPACSGPRARCSS